MGPNERLPPPVSHDPLTPRRGRDPAERGDAPDRTGPTSVPGAGAHPDWLTRFAARLPPALRTPSRLVDRVGGRTGAFLSALVYLFGRESTILICSFCFAFLLSVFPFIVLLLTLANFFTFMDLRPTILEALLYFFPVSQEWIVRNLDIYIQGLGALQVVSFVLLAWAGSAFFFALEAALESAYRVHNPRNFVGSQILGTVLTLGFGLAMFATMILLHGGVQLGIGGDRTEEEVFRFLLFGLSFLVLLALLVSAFHWLPNQNTRLRDTLPEALFATVLLVAGSVVFRAVVPSMNLEEVYGPFYVSVSILLWAYWVGCIVVGSGRLGANGFFRGSAHSPPALSAEAPRIPEGRP